MSKHKGRRARRGPAAPGRAPTPRLDRIRLAVLATALAVALGLALIFKETASVFTAFMVLRPLLLAAAFLLLGWAILQDLRARRVL